MTTPKRGIGRIIKSNLSNAAVFAILFIFEDGNIEFIGSYQTKELAVFGRIDIQLATGEVVKLWEKLGLEAPQGNALIEAKTTLKAVTNQF